jgi:hypothetical protein
MGQERRIGAVCNISALPPRADVGADIIEPPVSAITSLMHRSNTPLLDHPVGAQHKLGWRQDIEKDGAARLPDLLGFGRSDHARALESGRCWRAVVFCPISLRFGYVLARRGHGCPQEHDERAADETAGDSCCHGFLVTRSLPDGLISLVEQRKQ